MVSTAKRAVGFSKRAEADRNSCFPLPRAAYSSKIDYRKLQGLCLRCKCHANKKYNISDLVFQVKRQHEKKMKHLERMRDHLLESIDIAENQAFFADVPGWNAQSYIDAVEDMRSREPIALPAVGKAARSARSPMTPSVGQISGGMARARITEMEDID
jgi:hypothetical protein